LVGVQLPLGSYKLILKLISGITNHALLAMASCGAGHLLAGRMFEALYGAKKALVRLHLQSHCYSTTKTHQDTIREWGGRSPFFIVLFARFGKLASPTMGLENTQDTNLQNKIPTFFSLSLKTKL